MAAGGTETAFCAERTSNSATSWRPAIRSIGNRTSPWPTRGGQPTFWKRTLGFTASRVQFPPVPGSFPAIPWNDKEDGFVCVGRVVPEKRLDEVIHILRQVRRASASIFTSISWAVLTAHPMRSRIRQLASRHSNWVHAEGLVTGQAKRELMARHKFGINGCRREAFGIAVAEQVKAGCIAFVPNGGGQTEIVNHPMLTFTDEDDAVKRIQTVLSSPALQEDLRLHLAGQAQELSSGKFMSTVRQLVAEFLNAKHGAGRMAGVTPSRVTSFPRRRESVGV